MQSREEVGGCGFGCGFRGTVAGKNCSFVSAFGVLPRSCLCKYHHSQQTLNDGRDGVVLCGGILFSVVPCQSFTGSGLPHVPDPSVWPDLVLVCGLIWS